MKVQIKSIQKLYSHNKAEKIAEEMKVADPDWSYIVIKTNEKYARIEVKDEDGEIIETHFSIV